MSAYKENEFHPRRNRGQVVEVEGESLFEHYTFTAASNQGLLRVDKFLSNLLPAHVSRSKVKNAADTGSITVNGKRVKPSYKVKPGDEVKVLLPYPPAPETKAENIPLDIRYEDEHLLILHKPANMVCHPALGHRTGTLIHGLLWHFDHLDLPSTSKEVIRPGLVHRLDKNTTGILVIAKQEYAMAHLSKQFFDRTSDRTYQAIAWGDLPEDKGTIEAHIGRHLRERKLYAAFPKGNHGKHAVTHYEVLDRFGIATLVKLKLETGRTHQIRVHMKSIGHTLVGDFQYGGDQPRSGPNTKKYKQFVKNCLNIMPRQALHAKTLGFTHPATGERMTFDSELPEDFRLLLEKLAVWRESYL